MALDAKPIGSESAEEDGGNDWGDQKCGEWCAVRSRAIERGSHHKRPDATGQHERSERKSDRPTERAQAEVAAHEKCDQVHFRSHPEPDQKGRGEAEPADATDPQERDTDC